MFLLDYGPLGLELGLGLVLRLGQYGWVGHPHNSWASCLKHCNQLMDPPLTANLAH